MRLSVQRAVYAVLVVFAISVFGYGASARAETTQDLHFCVALGSRTKLPEYFQESEGLNEDQVKEIEMYVDAWIRQITRSWRSPIMCNLDHRYPTVYFEIDSAGVPQNVRLARSSTYKVMDDKAISCIKALSAPSTTPSKYRFILTIDFDNQIARKGYRQWNPLTGTSIDNSTSNTTHAEEAGN